MRQRGCALLLGTALCLGLFSGCGRGQDPNALQVQPEKADRTVLTLYMPIDGNTGSTGAYKDIIADFNACHQDLELRVDGISTADGFNQALEQRLEAGGEGADLFIVNADRVKGLQAEGYFQDLSGLPAYEMLSDAARDQATVDGLAYAIPLEMTAYGLYVNVGLLREHGLEPPRDREAFLRCCRVLKDGGVTPIGINRWYAMTAPAMAGGLAPLYQSPDRADLIQGLNDGSVKISAYMLDGFRFFEELVRQGYYGDGLTPEAVDKIKAGSVELDAFTAGQVAFLVLPMGNEKLIESAAPGLELIEQGIPALDGGSVSLPSTAARLCVNAKGAHLEAAMEAAEYLTSSKAEEFLAGASKYVPAIQGAEPPEIDPRAQALYELAVSPGQVPIEDMSLDFDYWGTIRELCLKIVGGMSAEEAAREYDRIQMEWIGADGA